MRSRLTYANVMATLAVFLAFGGVGWAVVKFPANSVGTKQLKKGAVTLAKISSSARGTLRQPIGSAGGALTGKYPSPSIAANAITSADISPGLIDGAPATASMRTLGTGPDEAAAGNDPRFDSGKFTYASSFDGVPGTYGGSGGTKLGPVNCECTSDWLVTWSGTAYTSAGNEIARLSLAMDSPSNVIYTSGLYANDGLTHLSLPAVQTFIPNVPAGPHTFYIEAGGSNTKTDSNDVSHLTIVMLSPS